MEKLGINMPSYMVNNKRNHFWECYNCQGICNCAYHKRKQLKLQQKEKDSTTTDNQEQSDQLSLEQSEELTLENQLHEQNFQQLDDQQFEEQLQNISVQIYHDSFDLPYFVDISSMETQEKLMEDIFPQMENYMSQTSNYPLDFSSLQNETLNMNENTTSTLNFANSVVLSPECMLFLLIIIYY